MTRNIVPICNKSVQILQLKHLFYDTEMSKKNTMYIYVLNSVSFYV